MGFRIIKDDGVIELGSQDLFFHYTFSKEYPKIVLFNHERYHVWLTAKDRLEEEFETYGSAEAMCIYLRGLEYNIRGLWNAGG